MVTVLSMEKVLTIYKERKDGTRDKIRENVLETFLKDLGKRT